MVISTFLKFGLAKIIQASITNQHILYSTHIFIVRKNLCSIELEEYAVSTKQKTLNSNINKTKEQTVDDHKKIWLNFLYVGDKGDH